MQTEKALINHFLRVSEVSWTLHIPTIKIFVLIYLWNLLFSWKVAYFLTVSIVFSVYKLNNFKTRTAMNAEISVYVICVEAIIYSLLYNLHYCTFKETLFKLLLWIIFIISGKSYVAFSERKTMIKFIIYILRKPWILIRHVIGIELICIIGTWFSQDHFLYTT